MIKTIDSDVVCIAISCVKRIPELEELWIKFESGKTLQFIPIHEISNALGIPVCEALPFFHSFIGCDTTSSFPGRGKKTFYDVWKIYPDITALFRKLSKGVPEVSDEDLQLIEKFVVSLYSNTCNTDRVNVARQILFTQGKRALDNSTFWWRCLDPIKQLPDFGLWGWSLYTTLCMSWSMCYKYIVDVVNILLRRKSNILHWMIYFDSFWLWHTDNRNAYLSLAIIMPFL